MNDVFWMPMPQGEPSGFVHFDYQLTAEERAVLRRLRRGERAAKAGRHGKRIRQRAAVRRRRRTLDRLVPGDLRSLVQIVMQLEL